MVFTLRLDELFDLLRDDHVEGQVLEHVHELILFEVVESAQVDAANEELLLALVVAVAFVPADGRLQFQHELFEVLNVDETGRLRIEARPHVSKVLCRLEIEELLVSCLRVLEAFKNDCHE